MNFSAFSGADPLSDITSISAAPCVASRVGRRRPATATSARFNISRRTKLDTSRWGVSGVARAGRGGAEIAARPFVYASNIHWKRMAGREPVTRLYEPAARWRNSVHRARGSNERLRVQT